MKLSVDGEISLNKSVSIQKVCAVMQKIKSIKLGSDKAMYMRYRNHEQILTLKGQGEITRCELVILKEVISELQGYLKADSLITIGGSDGRCVSNSNSEYTVRLFRDQELKSKSMELVSVA